MKANIKLFADDTSLFIEVDDPMWNLPRNKA